MKPTRQSKPRGASGSTWAKLRGGYWDKARVARRLKGAKRHDHR